MVKQKSRIFVNRLKWVLRARRSVERRAQAVQFMKARFLPSANGKKIHIIDIGAGSGEFCYLVRKQVETMWAIEPNPSRFSVIHNLNFEKLRALNCAVGDKTGLVTLKVPRGHDNLSMDMMSFVSEDKKWHKNKDECSSIKVRQIQLDQLVYLVDAHSVYQEPFEAVEATEAQSEADQTLQNEIVFVRLRSPGREAQVLNGMKMFLRVYQPVIFWQYSEGIPTDQVSAFMELCQESYSCYKISDSQKLSKVDVQSIGSDPEGHRVGYMFVHTKTQLSETLFEN